MSLSLTSQTCHPLQKEEYSLCLQYLLTWVVTSTGFLGVVLMDTSQGAGCWQEKGATPSVCGCWLQKCWGLSISSQPLAELCLVKSLVPVTQRKGAAEPLCLEGCGTSSKEWRGLYLHREGARHLHLWNSSGGELTDVNLLQMPNLLLALGSFFFFSTSVLWVLKMHRRNFCDKELKKMLCLRVEIEQKGGEGI